MSDTYPKPGRSSCVSTNRTTKIDLSTAQPKTDLRAAVDYGPQR